MWWCFLSGENGKDGKPLPPKTVASGPTLDAVLSSVCDGVWCEWLPDALYRFLDPSFTGGDIHIRIEGGRAVMAQETVEMWR